MTEHLKKLESEVAAVDKASILEKADAAMRALFSLTTVLRDFENRIAALEGRIDEQKTT